MPLWLMIETARGAAAVFELAREDGVSGLVFGSADYRLSVGSRASPEERELDHARQRILLAARAAGVCCWDAPWFAFRDLEGLRLSARRAFELGFDGQVRHPPGATSGDPRRVCSHRRRKGLGGAGGPGDGRRRGAGRSGGRTRRGTAGGTPPPAGEAPLGAVTAGAPRRSGAGVQRPAATTLPSAAPASSERSSPSPPAFRSRTTAVSVSGSIQAAARYPATLPPWP